MHSHPRRTTQLVLTVLLAAILLMGCGGSAEAELPASALPEVENLTDWVQAGEVAIYDEESLFELVNGQAPGYVAYGFEQVAVQQYENAEGVVVNVEIWQLATPADAFGLFSGSQAGQRLAIGTGGDTDPGRRIIFWQDRYMVQLFARQPIEEDRLLSLAEAVADQLPVGGNRPELVDQLPEENLIDRSVIFFHEEISIQHELWLGGENLLGLSQGTDGVVARYEIDGQTVHLLLIDYPNPAGASEAFDTLTANDIDVLASHREGDMLGAAFGPVALESEAVEELLRQAVAGTSGSE